MQLSFSKEASSSSMISSRPLHISDRIFYSPSNIEYSTTKHILSFTCTLIKSNTQKSKCSSLPKHRLRSIYFTTHLQKLCFHLSKCLTKTDDRIRGKLEIFVLLVGNLNVRWRYHQSLHTQAIEQIKYSRNIIQAFHKIRSFLFTLYWQPNNTCK